MYLQLDQLNMRRIFNKANFSLILILIQDECVAIKRDLFAMFSVCSRISHMILCTTAVQKITAVTKTMICLQQTIYQTISCRRLQRLPLQNIKTTTHRSTESR